MSLLLDVPIPPTSIERFVPILGEACVRDAQTVADALRVKARDRIVWNVNSTAVGGGVAEMLRSLLSYARGAGVDARWVVIRGEDAFFRTTKRIHNALHGERGDGSPLGDEQRALYEATAKANAQELLARIRPMDIVILHDPQTAGLAPYLRRSGAGVIWRCHIGNDVSTPETALGWAFLSPYLDDVDVSVFTREAYIPPHFDRARTTVIVPSIDPFSAKNEELSPETVRAIVTHVGVVSGPAGSGAPAFTRDDGSPGRVDRFADVLSLGPPPAADVPLVVQVSRWDDLKDPIGVVRGFAKIVEDGRHAGAQLLLAGPNVHAVADDPDGARVFGEVTEVWRALPHRVRSTIHLASLPTADVEENAAIVNAIQRHATVVVQKSLREGFGLTVAEAMWKGRAVVASAVGGIQDQIEDGVHGLLLRDPCDLDAFADALARLLEDPALARRLGESARARVRDRFLGLRHIVEYGVAIGRLDRVRGGAP